MIWHSASTTDVLKHFEVDDKKGLANGVAASRLEQYGQNVIRKIERKSFSKEFLLQLNSKMVIVLVITAIISFILSLVYNEVNSFSSLLIIAIIILNALISAFYICRSSAALDDIKQITNPSVTVLREGIKRTINAAFLVPGDIIILEEGNYIPADARIIESNQFRCNELNLTGSEIPVDKDGNAVFEDITLLEDRKNMVFLGSSVVSGTAKAVVTATGLDTELGKTSTIIQQTGEDRLPIQNKLDFIGKITNSAILIVCAIVFVISLIQNFSAANFANMTIKMFTNSVALAVAAIPEGLPAIATIVIALGIQRILKDNIVIKDTKAVELLGKTEILCCDKTGILTRNKMEVTKIFDGTKICDLKTESPDDNVLTILRLATACSTLQNDSTEDAISNACLTYNSMSRADVNNLFPHVAEVPFSSERKSTAVITMINKRPFAIVKGAAELVVPNCTNCNSEEILKTNDMLADQGLRIVCIAMRPLDELPANPTAEEIERELTFIGLLALDDPPRDGVVDDIEACQKAGIRTIMMTGDNLITAKSVARRIGILKDDTLAITGADLNTLSDEELAKNIHKYSVFARISPSDKLRIVKAWQAHKKIVTITGDNIEDAESLALADVGCAVGKFGAEVAKGNADIIISNNRFHSVLMAIRESRGLFSNIKKSVYFSFSCNISEIITVLFGLLSFGTFPIAAVQLLWINLLTDCAPAISFSLERSNESDMTKQSSGANSIFSLNSILMIAFQSIYIALISLIAYSIGNDFSDAATAATMTFAVLGMSQIFHCFNCKSQGTIFKRNLFSNTFMNVSVAISLFIIIFLLFTPAGYVFGLKVLTIAQFLTVFLLSISVIPVFELLKAIFAFCIKKIGYR